MSDKESKSTSGEGLPTLLEDTFLPELPDFDFDNSEDNSVIEHERNPDFVFPLSAIATLEEEESTNQSHSNSVDFRWDQSNSTTTTLNEKSAARHAAFGDMAHYPSIRHRPHLSKDLKKDMSSSTVGGSTLPPKVIVVDTNPWGYDTIDGGRIEDDDYLHDPQKEIPAATPFSSSRGILNIGTLAFLILGILTLFAGYPIIAHFTLLHESKKGGFNIGGTNGTGQVAQLPNNIRTDLIDADTPDAAKTRTGFDGQQYTLVFSDEFNVDGRSFYPGDDPFWEALDLHYWATNNYEWYDPAGVTTKNGKLQITLSQTPEHNLNFRGGMLTSWNKFCFTGGYVEVSVQMPGTTTVSGLWPAAWLMGNLGRAGYGATLEGAWPYSYESCDVGTLQNQTDVKGNPVASQTGGDTIFNRKHHTNALSFLSGQRMSSCTCPADYPDLHPGPLLPDGTLQGRGAPEIDIFEAQVNLGTGALQVSQSAQWAPFNMEYTTADTSGQAYITYQPSSKFNTYTGEITQQSGSVVTDADQNAVQYGGANTFATYALEYQPGDDGYVEWVSAGKPSWKLNSAYNVPDTKAQISRRPFSQEPMYILFNLGISQNFASPQWADLEQYWPAIMQIDYVRVYQRANEINVGCDPPDYPTADFINRHAEAYTNPNMTVWGGTANAGGYGANWPRNNLNPNGCNASPSVNPGSPTVTKAKAPYLPSYAIGNN